MTTSAGNQKASQADGLPATDKQATRPRSRGRLSPADTAALEANLLNIALQEFLQYGYGAASTNRIIQTARISKPTLYARYPTKEALFRAVISEQIKRLAPAAFFQPGTQPPSLKQGLTDFANHLLRFSLQGDLRALDQLIYSESRRFPELGAAAAERTALGIRRVSDFIRECATRDGIPCSNPDAIAEAFIFMIRGWYANIILTNQQVSVTQREHWVERIVHALLSSRHEW